MRVTAKTKQETRVKILDASGALFKKKGFSNTTTRDIARVTGIAAGTLFNYFGTKEELALALVGVCLSDAEADFERRRRGEETLDELLFAHVAAGLRRLRPHRAYVEDVLRAGVGPSQRTRAAGEGERIRATHLGTVRQLIAAFDGAPLDRAQRLSPSSVELHLYWTLFLGVLSYWAGDGSPDQEDTLALLDHSMKLFVASLAGRQDRRLEVNDGTIAG